MRTNNNFPVLIETFFTDRLMQQRQASPNTIASYRDSFCLLFKFAKQHLNKEPSTLSIEDLDAAFIGAFLNHIENDRGNCARSRNVRLAAIHSFFKYIALLDPSHSALIQRVLSIPTKKYDHKPIDFLTKPEIDALIAAPDRKTWNGHRDRTLLLLAIQTGLRVSELIGLTCKNIILDSGAHVRCKGKGRKDRCTPLRKEVVATLRSWLRERSGQPDNPLFPNIRGGFFSRDGVEYLLAKHVAVAMQKCPSMQKKRISPHVLRHTAAMELLQHGVDITVIALWLGHESPETTQVYVQADMKMKEKALAKTTSVNVKPGRYQPGDQLLAFLKSL
ncbi:MAG: site-specific integrase [Deltaproteobacteria bacterium]|nr:site-specific integrase [Deltaproteobacteria bacterium]